MRRNSMEPAPGTLANALAALVDDTAGAEAPERVENAAIEAFRAAHARPKPAAVSSANVVAPRAWRRPVWLTAAAAAALVAVLGIANVLTSRNAVRQPAGEPAVVAHNPAPIIEAPTLVPVPPDTVPTVRSAQPPRDAAWRGGRVGRIQPVRATVPAPVAVDEPGPIEVTTDYYALVAGGDLAPVDGGQVVRMRVPRASLATLGFHMDADRDDDQVTADIVVGNDGIARAIRFVQTIDTATAKR